MLFGFYDARCCLKPEVCGSPIELGMTVGFVRMTRGFTGSDVKSMPYPTPIGCFAWLDTGIHDSLIDAGQFVQTVEHRQGLKVACLEEIAYRQGWVSADELIQQGELLKKTGYGQYLLRVAAGYK